MARFTLSVPATAAVLLFTLTQPAGTQAQPSGEPRTELVSTDDVRIIDVLRSAMSADGRFILMIPDCCTSHVDEDFLNIVMHDRSSGASENLPDPRLGLTEYSWEAMSADAGWIILRAWDEAKARPVLLLYDRNARSARRIGFGHSAQISADGRWVVFFQTPPDDAAAVEDARGLSVYDRATQRTSALDVRIGESDWAIVRGISANGRFVLFESTAPSLVDDDTNGFADVFLHDRANGTIRRISVAATGEQANGWSSGASMSDDGRYVAFESRASNLVDGDSNGTADVFVVDTKSTAVTRVSLAGIDAQLPGDSTGAVISRNGNVVAFRYYGPPFDPRTPAGLYVHERATGITRPADIDSAGRSKDANGWNPAISGDGRFVTFTSWSRFVPDDQDGNRDLYLHDFGTRTPGSRLSALERMLASLDTTAEVRTRLSALVSAASQALQGTNRRAACQAVDTFLEAVQDEWNNALTGASAQSLFAEGTQVSADLGCPPADIQNARFARSRFRAPSGWWFGLAAGDFNGDGRVDAAGTHDDAVSVFPGDGYGSFGTPLRLPAAEGPRGLVAADVNHDGADDLLAANQFANSASVFVATPGALAFKRIDLPTGRSPTSVAAGDFTADGRIDVAIANADESFVTLYRGRARGGWARVADLEVGYSVTQIAAADINRDGCDDLLMTGYGAVSVALCAPDSRPVLAGYLRYGIFGDMAPVDVNGDGWVDLATVDHRDGGVRLFVNDGGWLSDAGQVDVPMPFFVAAGDVTGDGRADLIVTNYSPSGLWVIRGNGDGTFGIRQWVSRDLGASEVALADVNRDGALDVLVLATTARSPDEYERAKPSLNVLLNNPSVNITTPNTAEQWAVGSVRRIAWRHRLPVGTSFSVGISRDGGASWTTLGSTRTVSSTAQFWWRVAGPLSSRVRFRVSSASDPTATDLNDAPIVVGDPVIELEGLNSRQWAIGSTQLVRWTHNLGAGVAVTMELSRDGGASWETIGRHVSTSGSESSRWEWNVTGPATSRAMLRVRAADGLAAGVLPGIVIAAPFLELLRIRPATPWNACEPRHVRWRSNLGRAEAVRLQVSADGAPWVTIGETTSGGIEYSPPELVGTMRLQAVWAKNGSVQATLPAISILTTPAPNWCYDGQ